MQYTFTETEIGPDGEPTGEAIATLEQELREHLHQNYPVDDVEVDADYLLGIVDDAKS